MLFVHCVFTHLQPMDTMMGLFISLTFSMFCSVCFMWLDTINTLLELNREFLWFQDASSFPQNTLTHVDLQNCNDGLCMGQECIPTEDSSRNNDCFCIYNSRML